MVATDHIFLINALLFLVGAGVVWFAPRPKAQVAAGVGGH